MQRKTLLVVAIIVLVLVGAFAFAQTGMLQGSFGSTTKFQRAQMFLHKSRVVTVVASPVVSVVVSDVTSEVDSDVTTKGGTTKVPSKVTSKVPSGVVSAVASGVPIPAEEAAKVNLEKLQVLTKTILESIAKEDFKNNPSKYILSDEQIKRVLDMYERSKS